MEKMIAKCGLICTDCEAYKATIKDDPKLRKAAAESWSKMFGVELNPDEIYCRGCQSLKTEDLFSHCGVCQIRSCAQGKGFTTCAECPDFGCDLVRGIWEHDKSVKANLDELRAQES